MVPIDTKAALRPRPNLNIVSTAAVHRRLPERVSQRHQTMSALAAAFAESGHGILPGMGTRPRSQSGPPMTLGNMRANGVRSLDGSVAAMCAALDNTPLD
jgi:hypothetical protein